MQKKPKSTEERPVPLSDFGFHIVCAENAPQPFVTSGNSCIWQRVDRLWKDACKSREVCRSHVRPYHVAICSTFKEPFQSGLGKQQVAILAKYQAQAAWAEPWKSMNGVDPPRGFAFSWFKIGNQDIGVYSVHLKSNLITHGNKEAETAKNIRKREAAITQLLAHVRDVIEARIPSIKGVVIAGDFNTNHDQEMFAAERTLDLLAGAGYQNGFEQLPLPQRVTHPGTHGFPDATFDFIFAKGLTSSQPTVAHTTASDHWPVTRDFSLR
jgi:endonuclease/exonuclease/phosphatase family metal-dependent hydrolase